MAKNRKAKRKAKFNVKPEPPKVPVVPPYKKPKVSKPSTKGIRKVSTAKLKKRVAPAKAKRGKSLKILIDKPGYVQLISDMEKFPLAMRVAAELWRSGVGIEPFENKYHLPDNPFSRAISEHMTRFFFNQGLDPERVPPVRPIYQTYEDPTAKVNVTIGRPSEVEADRSMARVFKLLKDHGWHESDIYDALERVERPSETVVVKLRTIQRAMEAIDDEPTPIRSSKNPAERALSCSYCHNTLKNRFMVCKNADGEMLHLHPSCYTFKHALPGELYEGQTVFDPVKGVSHQWRNAQWQPVKKEVKREEPENVPA